MGVNSGYRLQVRQRCENIVELFCRYQDIDILQVLAGFLSPRRLFMLQDILHERCLISGKALTPTKEIEEGVAMLNEERSEFLGCFGDGHPGSVRGVRAAGTVVEEYGRKRA
jgi:hypothetical protein